MPGGAITSPSTRRGCAVHQAADPGLHRLLDVGQQGPQLGAGLRHLVGDRLQVRPLGRQLLVGLVEPLDPAAVHRARILVAVDLEQPETVGGEPVVVVPVEDHCVLRGDAGAADELLERLLADDVAVDLVLQLGLPVEADRAADVAGVGDLRPRRSRRP